MKCLHCGYIVPDDSEFCPYCGARVEAEPPAQVNVPTSVASAQAAPTQTDRDRVTQSQRYFDPDYGYSPENPIVTSSIPMIGYYLASLRTTDGRAFTWERMARQDDSQIDSYCLYLDGKPYKGLYFTATGNDSEYVPADLVKDADAFEAAKQGITLDQLIANREAEKKKVEKGKARKKRTLKATLLACLLVALVVGGYFGYVYGYPYLRYQSAIKNIESNPQKSIEIFDSLGDYKNSFELGKWAHYYRMKQLGEEGDFAGAISESEYFRAPSVYGVLEDYTDDSGDVLFDSRAAMLDSKEQLEIYHLKYAAELVDNKEYSAAIDELNKVSNADKNTLLAECYYNLIIQSYEANDWSVAYDNLQKFSSTGKGKDAFDISDYRYKILYNYTEELIKENTVSSLTEAKVNARTLIIDYGGNDELKDLQARAIDSYTEARYNKAIYAMNSGDYQEAVSIFREMEDYKDSGMQMLEAMYQYVHTSTPPNRNGDIVSFLVNPYFNYAETLSDEDYKDSKVQFTRDYTG